VLCCIVLYCIVLYCVGWLVSWLVCWLVMLCCVSLASEVGCVGWLRCVGASAKQVTTGHQRIHTFGI
jgi:hypothetical protein